MPLRLQSQLERIPLPSLRYYTLISTSLLFANVLYFHHLIQLNKLDPTIVHNSTDKNGTIFYSNANTFSFTYIQTLTCILLSQLYSFLIFINAICCSIILIGKQLQIYIFGELRVIESQRLKDKFWNYAFYKFCFLFGVLGLENLNELILWISWFFILSFAILFCQLTKDRFELLSISPRISHQSLEKIVYFLLSLLCLCLCLFTICFCIGFKYGGLSIFFFMFAETILLTLDISYILYKYVFVQQDNTRTYMNYYIEFLFDILTLTIDIFYHLQMLFYHQTFMSMSSLIFFMQLKPLFNELTQRLKRHKSYRIAMIRMEKKYPLLTKSDLEEKSRKQKCSSSSEDICSICWEKFEKARCLPCGHLFHPNCLRSWLEQDTTCPICRLSLQEDNIQSTQNLIANNGQRRGRNHLFRFNGNRYSAWLPSFSIEINHNFPYRFGRNRLTDVQLTSMAQSIQQIFPQIPFEIIRNDLQTTQSMDTTIENLIERQNQIGIQQDMSGSEESLSDVEEPVHTESLLDSTKIIQNDDENFTWPLDPNLSFAHRKQQLILHMRRLYLEHERRLQSS